ncbi:MAG TPA: ADOP family duplicated permease [Thermoanaerobaculia bacterium]
MIAPRLAASNALRDLRHAGRAILRMPWIAGVVVVSLGFGIGVNTAIFAWIDARVLRPLPGVSGDARFLLVEPRAESGGYPGISWPEYRDLRERLGSFRELFAYRMAPLTVGAADRPERTWSLFVSGNYFSALGLTPSAGRFFAPGEVARPGGEPVAVISHDFWKARLAAQPNAVGRTLRVNDRTLTIVGIAPEGFQGTIIGLSFDLWVPATMAPELAGGSRELENRGARGYTAVGVLRAGATRERAQEELDDAMGRLARDFPDTNASLRGEVLAFWDSPRGPQRMMVRGLAILQVVMLLLLLVVCGNTASLLMARSSTRQQEMAVRQALGAGRGRIASLILAENLILALLGALLGIGIAFWASRAIADIPLAIPFPLRFGAPIELLSLLFAVLLGVGSGLLFGLPAALQMSRLGPMGTLRSGAGTTRRSALRDVLMGVEVALALVVLVVAASFLESFRETREDPGFRREGVLLATYDRSSRGGDADASREFAARLLAGVRALPGVESAAIAASVPLDIHGLPIRAFTLEGRARADGNPDEALSNTVTPGYFETMGIARRAGTDFADLRDTAAPPQVLVNEEFTRRFLAGAEPIGRRLDSAGRTYTIVGVVADSLSEAFGEPPTPAVYFSYRDRPAPRGEIHARTRPGAEKSLTAGVRGALRELDAGLPLYNVRTLSEHIETNLIFRRIPARMFAVLGPLLLALAAIGIYAVVAYGVARRTREIGLRLALGASARRVVVHVVAGALRVIGVGALAGWLIAWVISRDVAPGAIGAGTLLGVPALLLAVATAACWLPARRAASVDPMVALRQE